MHRRRWTSFASGMARIVFVGLLVSALGAQVSETRRRVGLPEDWTHHHLKFNTATLRQHPERAAREPRAAFQLYREARASLRGVTSNPQAAVAASGNQGRDWSVALGGGRIQVGNYPAKWTDDPFAPVTIANCLSDYVVFGLNVVGSATQANLVGLYNLYSSPTTPALCPGGNPLFLFAYNISTVPGGLIRTSPVLSLDGKKIAFIETDPTNGSARTILHVLNIPASNPGPGHPQGTSAVSPVVPAVGAMTSLTIATVADTRSSPWVDYATDTMYVCADNGRVYKITGVFNGTPTLAGAPWPKLINLNTLLTSPIFDDVTGKLFVGAGNGRVYSVSADNVSTAVTVLQVGTTGALNPAVLDTPIVDSTAGTLLAISSNDATVLHSAVVVQANTNNLTQIQRLSIGTGSASGTAVNMYGGDFDNAYFNDPATGHMLVCGTDAVTTVPTLYNLSFDSAAHLTTAAQLSAVSTATTARCGPITEFYNPNIAGGTDFFFFGVSTRCSLGTGTTNGCIVARSTAGAVTTSTAVPSRAGASGIIPDNDSPQANASSIYFTDLGSPMVAFKLTQLGLN